MCKETEAMAALGRFFQLCIEISQQSTTKEPIETVEQSARLGSKEAMKVVGFGKTKFNEHVKSGAIPSHMDGNRRMFFVRDLENFNRRRAKE